MPGTGILPCSRHMQPQPRVPCRRLQSVSLRTKAKLLCLNERMPDALFIAGDPGLCPAIWIHQRLPHLQTTKKNADVMKGADR